MRENSNVCCLLYLNIVKKEDIKEKYRNLIFDPHNFNDKDDCNEYNSNSDQRSL